MFKMRLLKTNKGYMTVEASFIVPLIMTITVVMMLALVFMYEKEYLRAGLYVDIYTIPYDEQESPGGYLNQSQPEDFCLFGEAGKTALVSGNTIEEIGVVNFKGSEGIHAMRGRDKCADRLRRWQLYDAIKEE